MSKIRTTPPETQAPTTAPLILSFWVATALLSVLGLLFVYESSLAESFVTFNDPYVLFRRQLEGTGIGIAACIAVMLIPLRWIHRYSAAFFWGAVATCIAIFIPGIGLELNGAHRWISLGTFVIQPVELLKLGICIYYSNWMSRHQQTTSFIALTAICALLIYLQPDVGSLLIVLCCAVGTFFIAGGKIMDLIKIAVLSIPVFALIVASAPYRLERIQTFFNPESDPLGSSFHVRQISLALGRGGLWGTGLTNSTQRFSYIPEASSDSIFAIVAEEMGFVGSTLIILLFCLFTILGIKIASKSSTSTSKLLGYSLCIWFMCQTLLNLAAVVQLVPLTGIPLPYFSYGRTSLVSMWIVVGLISRIGIEK